MQVVLDGGEVIDLGTLEETPTIGITDFSRRETDDFGVTTVVPRGFARRMSVKLMVPTDEVDALQRQLAELRATAAQWIADDRFAWLNFRGFYKDFAIDLALPPVSYCTLTVEGLAASEPFDDPGGDPAPEDAASTLRLLQPATIFDVTLAASSVEENDAPEWQPGVAYATDQLVIKANTHRIYQSVGEANLGNDPTGNLGKWVDIGPTNRWAMFDQALGSATMAQGLIEVTLAAGQADALALLDVTPGAQVHVEAAGYARTTEAAAGGTVLFLDLPPSDGQVIVTVTDSGTVAVGSLLIGKLVGLGLTESSPSTGITDYSRKSDDDFGEVTIVERSWAKRMAAKALIDTDAIDVVAGRIAAVRAKPALWIGDDTLDVLAVYGFFKDFGIEVGGAVSKLSLSIEGLSTAGKVAPLGSMVNWPDIADPDGTKPDDNATYGAPGNSPVGNLTGNQVVDAIATIDTLVDGIVADATALKQVVRQLEVGGNLLTNTEFGDGTASWDLVTNEPQFYTWGTDNADFVFPGEHYQGLLCNQRNGDLGVAIVSEWVYIDKGSWVQISAWLASRECVSLLRLQWGDENKNYLADAAESDDVYHPFRGGPSWDDFKRVWCVARIPDNARYARLVVVKGGWLQNPANDLSWTFLLRPMLAVASYDQSAPSPYLKGSGAGLARANARIQEVETLATGIGQAAAQRLGSLEASVGGPGGLMARTSTVESVAADALTRTAGAIYQQTVSAGGGRAQVTMFVLDQGGNAISGIDFVGDNFTFRGNVIIDGDLQTRKLAPNAAQSIQWVRTASAVSLPVFQQTRIAQLTFQKDESFSTLNLLSNVRMKSGDDITGEFRLINLNNGAVEDTWPIWMVGANDNFQVPIALNWMATGWATGPYTLALDFYNSENDAPTWAEAGCTITVQEIKRGGV